MDERTKAVSKYQVILCYACRGVHVVTDYPVAFFRRVEGQVQPHFSEANDAVCFVFHGVMNDKWSIANGQWGMSIAHSFVSKICIPRDYRP